MSEDLLRDSTGRTITPAQAEQEYKKSLIVAGKPLDGPDYAAGLQAWLSTYDKAPTPDKRVETVAFIAFGVPMLIVAFVAIIAAVAGGGILGFFLILIVGGIGSFLFALLVTILVPAKKGSNA